MGFFQWWYGDGWARQVVYARDKVAGVYDYFSIDLLVKSWFAPFRQISAGKVRGSLQVQWRAFLDRTISRFIGAFMRTLLIIIGAMCLLVFSVGGALAIALWALLPLFPVAGIVLAAIGWVPWTA